MLRSTTAQKLLRCAAFCLAILAASLMTAAMFLDYEVDAHYFRTGAFLPVAALICALLSSLCGSIPALVTREAATFNSPFPPHRVLLLSPIGFLLAGGTILVSGNSEFLNTAVGTLLLLASLYGFCLCAPSLRQRSALISLLGLLPILACILLNAYYYFDVSIQMNAPIKIALQIALLFAMLSYTGEVRFHLGRPMPRLYVLISAWLTGIGSLLAISLPVSFLAGTVSRADYAAGAILLASVMLTQHRHVRRLLAERLPDSNTATEDTSLEESTSLEENASLEENTSPEENTSLEENASAESPENHSEGNR
ncbi:MAG: hypothetical protein IIX80_01825 [Clostridia bacterium]|nr:hypothetical protein [Clostridia bacterium]